jgi:hypothetical protein
MSSGLSTLMLLTDLQRLHCREETENFIKCKLGGEQCRNINQITEKVCDNKIKLSDLVVEKDIYGHTYIYQKIPSYVHHSER